MRHAMQVHALNLDRAHSHLSRMVWSAMFDMGVRLASRAAARSPHLPVPLAACQLCSPTHTYRTLL